ncbi:hypothetical protein BvCmsA75A_00989 [Escherichia coli]|nr:hypothetical protein BvCmsA75A_00989 [Escherichia coli]
MSLKEHYYKVSYCGRDSRFRLFPAQFRMYAANAQVFGVEADAKNLPQNRNISLQYRSPDYPFLY